MTFLLNFLKRLAQGIALLVGAIVLYVAYSYYTTVYHYNYRLTLEVEADGKVYSGSSVISVQVEDNRKALWVYPGWATSAWGGSPWVDLSERGVVLVAVEPIFYQAPIGSSRPYGGGALASIAFFPGKELGANDLIQMSKLKERGEINPDRAQIIWMPNPNSPRSAEFFPPNDQAEFETRGIKVRGLYVEMTNEKADFTAIHGKFPWLKTMSKTNPVDHQLPNGLNARTLMGEYK